MTVDAKEGIDKILAEGLPPASEKKTAKILTMDEILAGLSELAQHGDGAQKSQAYRLLLGASSTAAMLPPPLSGPEIIQRMMRLMKLLGPGLTQACYRRAFPRSNAIAKNPLSLQADSLDLPPDFKFPRTVKHLYKLFPEFKGPGFPRGFPINRGILIQREWLKDLTIKTLLARKQQEEDARALEIKEGDQEVRGAATDGPSPATP